MTPEQLRALLAAGLITNVQFAAAQNPNAARPVLDLHMHAPGAVRLEVTEADGDAPATGILTADVVTRYEEMIPSHGMILHTGCLEPRQPLVKNKLLRDHNHNEPVGFMTDVDDARMGASWQVASTEIDRVSQEVSEHLRDGLSVGFSITEYEIDDDWILHVYKADWYETSLCAIPAVHEAGVTSVAAALATARKENRTMNRAQLAAALAAGTITQEQHDAALAALDATEAALAADNAPVFSAPVSEPSVAVLAGPDHQETPAPVAHVRERSTLAGITRRLVTVANTGDHAAFQLALADIIPADDAAPAFLREDWQGELWRDDKTARPWIDAFGAPKELTSLKGKGWKWVDEPEVDEYAGNKTEVPTNEIQTGSEEFTAFRIAAGWDVDRAFEDFASTEFWPSFWAAVMRSYKVKSNAGIRIRALAAATALTDTPSGVLATLKTIVRAVRPYGKANRVFLGDDLFEELEDLDTEKLPLWLKSAVIGLDIAEASAEVGQLRILNDSSMPALQAAAFDNRGAIVRERSPFKVQALNVARAGIDVGIYSYLRFDPQDARTLVKVTAAAPTP